MHEVQITAYFGLCTMHLNTIVYFFGYARASLGFTVHLKPKV